MVRRGLHLTVRLAGWLLASLAVLAGIGVWRLASGPLPLDVVTPYLERALSVEGGELTTEIEATELRIGRRWGVALVAVDVAARNAAGELLFDLPEVEVGLSTSALLRHQVLAPERLRVRSPRVVLVRRADGSVGLGGTTGAAEPGDNLVDLKVLAGVVLAEPQPDLPLSFVDLVEVEGATVTLRDELSETRLTASGGSLSMVRDGGSLAARANVGIERDGRVLALTGLARFDPVQGRMGGALDFEDVRPPDLRLIRDLLPEEGAAALERVPLEGVDLGLRGRLRARADLTGELSEAHFRIESDGGRIVWPEELERPLDLGRLDITGSFEPAARRLTIEQLRVVANGATVRATGTAQPTPDGPRIRAEASLRDVAVEELAALWPVRAADEARAWVTENIRAGHAPEGVVLIDLRPGDLGRRPLRREAVTGSFAYQDLTIRYFKPLPPVGGVDGTATFDAQTMTFEAGGGRLGRLRAERAAVTITGIGIKGRDTTQLEVATSIAGPIEDALALIDLPPFGFASELGIAPRAAAGSARTLLQVGLPLHRDVDEDEVRIRAESTLADVAVERLFGLADLTEGAFELEVDRATMVLEGRARFAGTPVEVDWEEVFSGKDYDRRFQVRGMVGPGALAAFGFDNAPVGFEGAARTRLEVVDRGGLLAVDAALDLATARLGYAPLAWRKPLGEAARLQARLEVGDGSVEVERFELESSGLSASGSALFGLDPVALLQAEIDRFEQGEQRLAAGIRLTAEDQLEVSIDARRLDLRPFLASDEENPDDLVPGLERPVRLAVSAREVLLFEDRPLRDLRGQLARDRQGWATADLEATLGTGRQVELTLDPEGGRRHLVLTSDDAGELLRTLDGTRRLEGGQFRLEADLEAQRPVLLAAGRLTIDDFKLRGAPTLARLLTVASLTGIGNLLQGEGIFVDRLEVPFRLEGDRLNLERGRLSGSQLGLTVDGEVDLAAERLDLDGTIVPVYGLNRAIGAIPVIGDFLTGSEGVGAFAASYRMTGSFEDPAVSVNPLSALTPGFLRDLFTGIREGTLEPPELPADRN